MKPEDKNSEALNIIANYRPIDDDFMRELFRGYMPLAQEIIRTVTGISSLTLVKQETQYDLKLLGARSICLDFFGFDDKGRQINIEIQRNVDGASPFRARYHSSAVDVEFLKAGADFSELPVKFIIFFMEHDIFKKGKLIYHFVLHDPENDVYLNDGTHIIYVNCSYDNPDDTSDLAKLAHDFLCSDPDDMYTKILADRTRYFKESEEGVSFMCNTIEELKKEAEKIGEERGKKIGEKKNSIKIAAKMLKLENITTEQILSITGLSGDELNDIAASLN